MNRKHWTVIGVAALVWLTIVGVATVKPSTFHHAALEADRAMVRIAYAIVPAIRGTGLQISAQSSSPCNTSATNAGCLRNVSGVPEWETNSGGTLVPLLPSGSGNLIYATPANGSSGQAALRAAVAADIPPLSATYCSLTGCTYTGAVTFGGSVSSSAGAFNLDWSNFSGTWKPPTGGLAAALTIAGGSSFNIDFSNTSGKYILPAGGIQVASSTAAGKPVIAPFVGGTQTASSTGGQAVGDTFSVPASAVSATGSVLRCTSGWVHAANTNSATVNVNFAGTNVCSTADATSGDIGQHLVTIRRTGATTADAMCIQVTSGFASFKLTGTAVTWANANTIQNTINTTTANGDATLHGLACEVLNP